MRVRHVDCPGCGAPLSLPKDETRGPCDYCGATLDIERPSAPRPEDTETVRLHADLRALDDAWRDARRTHEIPQKDGTHALPTRAESRLAIAGAVVFGFALLIASQIFISIAAGPPSFSREPRLEIAPGIDIDGLDERFETPRPAGTNLRIVAVFGVLLVTVVGVAAGRRIGTRAAAFERARNDYERERRRLLDEIAAGAGS